MADAAGGSKLTIPARDAAQQLGRATAPHLGRAASAHGRNDTFDPAWVPRGARQPRAAEEGPRQPKERDGQIWAPWGSDKVNPAIDLPPVAPYELELLPPAENSEAARLALSEARRKAREEARARPAFVADLQEQRRGPKKKDDDYDLGMGSSASPPKKRLGRSIYDAVQTHGHFGMVDSGDPACNGVRRVVCHVPKRSRGYILDIKPGEVIYANSGRGKPVGGRLDVKFVTRHQYFAPGRAVTSCVIGVPEEQWRRFA